MRKLLSAALLVALFAACGGGGNDDVGLAPGESPAASPSAPGDSGGEGGRPELPDGVEAAPKDGVNSPTEGKYVYTFAGQSTSAARATAKPVTAPEGAEFTSAVSVDGDEVTFVEQTSFGSTVATTKTRWTDDAVQELAIETKSSAGTVGCEMEEPIELIRVPIEAETIEKQAYDGEGAACDRTKETRILREETVSDAGGSSWSTWVFEIKTVGKSVGLTEEFTETKWFSPDLGKDIKTEVETVGLDADGKESYRAQTSTLLKSYPT